MNTNTSGPTGCCPQFDPTPWKDREVVWEKKVFVVGRVRSLFHIPLNFGSAVTKLAKAATAAHALDESGPWLSDENSLWGSDLMIPVKYPVSGQKNAQLSGTFLSFVFEGPYRDMGKWYASVKQQLSARGITPKRFLTWYTTCPKCAKAYEKNYVVIFAQK